MARQKADTPTCGWRDCDNPAVTQVSLDRGSHVCGECGTEITERAHYRLCEDHSDQYTASGDVTLLLLSAKEDE